MTHCPCEISEDFPETTTVMVCQFITPAEDRGMALFEAAQEFVLKNHLQGMVGVSGLKGFLSQFLRKHYTMSWDNDAFHVATAELTGEDEKIFPPQLPLKLSAFSGLNIRKSKVGENPESIEKNKPQLLAVEYQKIDGSFRRLAGELDKVAPEWLRLYTGAGYRNLRKTGITSFRQRKIGRKSLSFFTLEFLASEQEPHSWHICSVIYRDQFEPELPAAYHHTLRWEVPRLHREPQNRAGLSDGSREDIAFREALLRAK